MIMPYVTPFLFFIQSKYTTIPALIFFIQSKDATFS